MPPAQRPSALPDPFIELWVLFESCWGFEPTSRPTAMSVMTSHEQWHNAYERSILDTSSPLQYTVSSSIELPHAEGNDVPLDSETTVHATPKVVKTPEYQVSAVLELEKVGEDELTPSKSLESHNGHGHPASTTPYASTMPEAASNRPDKDKYAISGPESKAQHTVADLKQNSMTSSSPLPICLSRPPQGILKEFREDAKPEDLSLKIAITESRPRFNGRYSDVYIGLFGDNKVSLPRHIVE